MVFTYHKELLKNCVHAPDPQRTSTTILVRLCIHSFWRQSQIGLPTEVIWLSVSGLRFA